MRPAGAFTRDLRPLIPAQPEPVEAVEDVLLVGDRRASDVGVLEAEDERPARVPSVEVVEERRAGGPDVERAGGARRDPDAVGGHRVIVRSWVSAAALAAPGALVLAIRSPDETWTAAAGREPTASRTTARSPGCDSMPARSVMKVWQARSRPTCAGEGLAECARDSGTRLRAGRRPAPCGRAPDRPRRAGRGRARRAGGRVSPGRGAPRGSANRGIRSEPGP